MSICTGRDPQANILLESTLPSVQFALPSIGVMEALSALENELKYRRRFENCCFLLSDYLTESTHPDKYHFCTTQRFFILI